MHHRVGRACAFQAPYTSSFGGQTTPSMDTLGGTRLDLTRGKVRVSDRLTVWFWWIFFSHPSFLNLLFGKIQKFHFIFFNLL